MNGDIEDFTRENQEMFLWFFEQYEEITINELFALFYKNDITFKKENEVSNSEVELRLPIGHKDESLRLTNDGVEYINLSDAITVKNLGKLLVADVKKSRLIDKDSDVVKNVLQIPKIKTNDTKCLLMRGRLFMGYLLDYIYRFDTNEDNEMYLIIE